MKLVFKILNYELYHSDNDRFYLMRLAEKGERYSKPAIWNDLKLSFIDNKEQLIIRSYVQKRAREVIPRFFRPFKVYDTVSYKDKDYTVVDVTGLAKINGEWKEVISYIEKFGKVKYHREKEDFINKFKLIEKG